MRLLSNNTDMIRNYITIAVRNLLKHKIFSIINIVGLSMGIACCVLLALYIKDEFSYEKHFAGYENIYRITSRMKSDEGRDISTPRTSLPVAMGMLHEFPELETATRLINPPEVEQHLVRYEDKIFYEKKGYLVDSTFFDVFSYEFQEGDRHTALDAPATVVISAPLAEKIFGAQSALHESLIINSGFSTDTFEITGVLKPIINNSQTNADFYMSMNSEGWGEFINRETSWVNNNFAYSYLKVRPNASIPDLISKMNTLLHARGGSQLKEMGIEKTLGLQPIKEARLYSAQAFKSSMGDFSDLGGGSNILYVYILSAISLFILVIACINFMNLTTAKASQRAGEVGLRKSLGANRGNLIAQFLGESLTIVVVAMIVSLGLVQVSLPLFNEYTQKDLSINLTNVWYIIASLAIISLITGVLAGSYPAFFLSGFQPAKVLKDRRMSGSGSFLRKGLVVFQFIISITLISSILVIHKQMRYIQEKSLGFNPAYRILLPLRTNESRVSFSSLKSKASSIAGIKGITGATAFPSTLLMRDMPLYVDGSSMEKAVQHFTVSIDEDYFKLLDVPLLAGRQPIYETDSASFGNAVNNAIVNEASLKACGIDLSHAIGSTLHIDFRGRVITFKVVGVVENFHATSMHSAVAPMIFTVANENDDFVYGCLSVEASDYQTALTHVEKIWKDVNPNTPFESTMLSDNLQKQYESDQRSLSIITTFTALAIFISCLGLYGLSIFVAERKNKEIGIRKVLGASVSGIVGMLSKDFIKLVGVAFLISVPLAHFLMDHWLQTFAYKIDLTWTIFILGGVISLAIAWLTVSYESLRAAMSNPVDTLKND
jgi:putative ABC transport system permease protein